jgi:glycyl-tRNA synthetase beta chain
MSLLQVEAENSKLETRTKRAARKDAAAQTLPLLLEVGCEEIPARFLRDAEKGLGARVLAALAEARLLPATDPSPGSAVGAVREPPLQTYSTPRRLVVHIPALQAQQPDKVEEILGPPVKVAVDAAGKYTRAAESFAQKNSGRLEDLIRTTTPKGEYLSLRKTTEGRPARELLPELLPAAILGLSFPKSMYWTAKSAPRFVRPIRWIVAILGEGQQAQTVDFEILGVKAGNFTFGHRAQGGEPLPVTDFKNYVNELVQVHVEIDYGRRRDRFTEEARGLTAKAALQLVPDEWLADWISNSTEWPRPTLGSFDERFLHLPREILITVMRDHQRYFAVEDQQGSLRPHFVAVLNMDSDEKGLIRQGHERVLAARFRDAEFFWNADQIPTLRKREDSLQGVTYQAQLGSYADKAKRMRGVGAIICSMLEEKDPSFSAYTVPIQEAISLCKCDLTTQMVQEFPELQGIVGGLYGWAQREDKLVYDAIYDHYLPLGAEGKSPRSKVGAVVSLADKLDSVVAGFAVGHQPTSSGDPFALRRHGNGIIKVLLEFKISISLWSLIQKFHEYLAGHAEQGILTEVPWSRTLQAVHEFFRERLEYYLEDIRYFRYDTVRAVLAAAVCWDNPLDATERVEAMEVLRGGEDFEALSAAAKRIRNILAKSASAADWQPGEVSSELLREDQEKELHVAYQSAAAEAGRLRAGRDYRGALEAISTLRPAVDRFFDKVLVMAEYREIRQNRLRLLKKLDELFSGIAHFAEIEGQ